MKRIDAILADEVFIDRMKQIEKAEKERIFCGHGYDHLLSVARIAYILYLEALEEKKRSQKEKEIETNLSDRSDYKELIYATALLHDIGRFSEEEKKSNHRNAGPIIAVPILERAGFSNEEIAKICEAIKKHGTFPEDKYSLAGMIYMADKMSRNCFECDAYDECNWAPEKKNDTIKY